MAEFEAFCPAMERLKQGGREPLSGAFGLSEEVIRRISGVFARHPEVEKAGLGYRSRPPGKGGSYASGASPHTGRSAPSL